jgi:eight-cysteine-cluster-containing protein
MNYKKGIMPVVVFLLVTAFAGLGMLVYSNLGKNIVKENSNSVVEGGKVDISDWKTYRNENYGFEFKYPSQYELNNDEDGFYDYSGERISTVVAKEKFINNSFFSIFASELSGLNKCSEKKKDSILLKRKIINGNTFIVVSDKQKDSAMGGARALYSYYQISHEGLCYELKSQVYWSEVGWASYAETGKSDVTDSEIIAQKEIVEKHAQILDDILSTFKFIDKNLTSEKPVSNLKPCFVGGCSSQLCGEKEDEMVSTCEWKDEYACYRQTKCERQKNGQCGWTETQEFKSCLVNPLK